MLIDLELSVVYSYATAPVIYPRPFNHKEHDDQTLLLASVRASTCWARCHIGPERSYIVLLVIQRTYIGICAPIFG
jgi:hypothetical protein